MLESIVVLLIALGIFFFFAALICAAVLGCVSRVRQYWFDHRVQGS